MSKPPLSPNVKMHYTVIIIGGGQAGLSMRYCLKQRGIDHIIFEKHRVAESWRSKRWDTFCLVTPNWQCQLPGFPYSGPDPNGFMLKDEIVAYVEAYARSFDPPLREGANVTRLRRTGDSLFEVTTDVGIFASEHVVIATGGYQEATLPAMAQKVAPGVTQIHSSNYQSPESL